MSANRPGTPPTVSDVARLAGVSTATVSRALNHPGIVAEDTRKAVSDAAAAIGYRVNSAARNLRRRQAGAVLVLVPNIGNPFFSEIISGIESELASTGTSVLVVDTARQHQPSNAVLDHLFGARADGAICLDGALAFGPQSQTGGDGLEMVYACEWHADFAGPVVVADNTGGAVRAVYHLVQQGHSRIGHVLGPVTNVLSGARLDGFKTGLAKHGLPLRHDWLFEGDFCLAAGRKAADAWLALTDRPTALFCASDEIAIALISSVTEAGIRVPQDLSVVGFDDIDVARYLSPPLTTIRQPRFAIGTAAARHLLARIAGTTCDEPTVFDVALIERQSTARPLP